MTSEGLILVTGGTGGLGHRVVPRLRAAGRRLRVLSRRPHESTDGVEYVVGDLTRGAGVEAAVAGAEIVIHCAGTGKIKADTAQAVNLARAARQSGVGHVLNISVVGADRIRVQRGLDRAFFAYFASQLAVERVVAASGLPWTNLRATQFHDGFILLMVRAMSKLPVVPFPAGFRFQPVDADEVADALVELSLGPPAGQVPDVAGPQIYDARYLLESYLRAVGKHRPLVPLALPGAAARAIRAGANLAPDRAVGRRTWEDFLLGLRRARDRATKGGPTAATE